MVSPLSPSSTGISGVNADLGEIMEANSTGQITEDERVGAFDDKVSDRKSMLSGDVCENGHENRDESKNATETRHTSSSRKQTSEEHVTAQPDVDDVQKELTDAQTDLSKGGVNNMETASIKDSNNEKPASILDSNNEKPASIHDSDNVKPASIQADLNSMGQRGMNDLEPTPNTMLHYSDSSRSSEVNSSYANNHQQEKDSRETFNRQEPVNTPRHDTSSNMLQVNTSGSKDQMDSSKSSNSNYLGRIVSRDLTATRDSKRKESDESMAKSEAFGESNFFEDKGESNSFDDAVRQIEEYSDDSGDDDVSSFISVSLVIDGDSDSDENDMPNEKPPDQEAVKQQEYQTNNDSTRNNGEVLNPENETGKDKATPPKLDITEPDHTVSDVVNNDEAVNEGKKDFDKPEAKLGNENPTESDSVKHGAEVNELPEEMVSEDSEKDLFDSDAMHHKYVDYDELSLEQIEETSELEPITEESTDFSSHTKSNVNPDEENEERKLGVITDNGKTEHPSEESSKSENVMTAKEQGHDSIADNSKTESGESNGQNLKDSEEASETEDNKTPSKVDGSHDKELHNLEANVDSTAAEAKPILPEDDTNAVPSVNDTCQKDKNKPSGPSVDETSDPAETRHAEAAAADDIAVSVEPTTENDTNKPSGPSVDEAPGPAESKHAETDAADGIAVPADLTTENDKNEENSTNNTNEFVMPRQQPPLPTNQIYTNHYTYRSYVPPTENDFDADMTSPPPITNQSESHTSHTINQSEGDVSHSPTNVNQSENDLTHSAPNTNQSEIRERALSKSPSNTSEKDVISASRKSSFKDQSKIEVKPIIHSTPTDSHQGIDAELHNTPDINPSKTDAMSSSLSHDNSDKHKSNINESETEVKSTSYSSPPPEERLKRRSPSVQSCPQEQNDNAPADDDGDFVLPRPLPPRSTAYHQAQPVWSQSYDDDDILQKDNRSTEGRADSKIDPESRPEDADKETDYEFIKSQSQIGTDNTDDADHSKQQDEEDVGFIPRPRPPMSTQIMRHYQSDSSSSIKADESDKVGSELDEEGKASAPGQVGNSENYESRVISDRDTTTGGESIEMSRDAPYGELDAQKDMDTDSNITGPAATSSRIDIRPNAGVKKAKVKPETDRKSLVSSSSTRGQARKTKKPAPATQQKEKRRRTLSSEGDRRSMKSTSSSKKVVNGRTRSISSSSSQKKRTISSERGTRKTALIKSKKDEKPTSVKTIDSKAASKPIPNKAKPTTNAGQTKKAPTEEPKEEIKPVKVAENETPAEAPAEESDKDETMEDIPATKVDDEPKAELDESFATSVLSDDVDSTGKEETEELIEVAPAFKPPVSESDDVDDDEDDSEVEDTQTSKEEITTKLTEEKETEEEEEEEEKHKKLEEKEEKDEEKDQPTKEPISVKTPKHVTTIVEPQQNSRMSSRMSRGSSYGSPLRNRRALYDSSRTSTMSSRPRTTPTIGQGDYRYACHSLAF